MAYFKYFGRRWHVLPDGNQVLLNDITKFSVFKENFQSNQQLFITHVIKDNERPETLSKRLYGTREYWWTILLFNNMFNVDEQWPLSESQLQQYIKTTYPDNVSIDTHHYVDASGLTVDLDAYRVTTGIIEPSLLIARYSLRAVSIQEYEQQINDNKRKIKLIDPDVIGQVNVDLSREFKQ